MTEEKQNRIEYWAPRLGLAGIVWILALLTYGVVSDIEITKERTAAYLRLTECANK